MLNLLRSNTTLTCLAACVLFALAMAPPASALERSGWELYRQASLYANAAVETPHAEASVAEFNHYLWGAAQILQRQHSVCLPQDVSASALWLPIYAALRDNESLRQQSRSELIASLLPALYPCATAETL